MYIWTREIEAQRLYAGRQRNVIKPLSYLSYQVETLFKYYIQVPPPVHGFFPICKGEKREEKREEK